MEYRIVANAKVETAADNVDHTAETAKVATDYADHPVRSAGVGDGPVPRSKLSMIGRLQHLLARFVHGGDAFGRDAVVATDTEDAVARVKTLLAFVDPTALVAC
jgi:hypothetical protein